LDFILVDDIVVSRWLVSVFNCISFHITRKWRNTRSTSHRICSCRHWQLMAAKLAAFLIITSNKLFST